MTSEGLLRGFFALIFAAVLAWGVSMRASGENWSDTDAGRRERQRAPIIAPFLLPLYLTALFVVVLALKGFDYALSNFIGLFFGIFLNICIYYLLLVLLLPLLRRYISAGVCALLWLLPNFLYLLNYQFMQPTAPKRVLLIEAKTAYIAMAVWAAGFVAVMLWKIIGHLVFRRRLLRNAQPLRTPEIVAQWKEAQRSVNLKRAKLTLMTSPDVTSPLSVGCYRFAIRVVLPEKQYTRDELELIFRHELVHILRMDGWTKFFLTFCTAMCWFNPLMWIAMRRSAEDLELSCDELVLSETNDAERRLYAELLLRTAADERGFTSCLAASASSLRYRLENILQPRKRITGAIVAGVFFLLMFLSNGHIALAYGSGNVGERFFSDAALSEYSVHHVTPLYDEGYAEKRCRDEAALIEYFAALELHEISANYSFPDDTQSLTVVFEGPRGNFGIRMEDHILSYTPLFDGDSESFYLHETPDWDYLFSLLEDSPAEVEPSGPVLYLHFSNPETGLVVNRMEAARQVISKVVDGEETVQLSPKPEPSSGTKISGFDVTQLELGWPIMPEHYTFTAEIMGASENSYDSESPELSDNAIPLEAQDARYRVEAFFRTEEAEYLCRFYFDVDLP